MAHTLGLIRDYLGGERMGSPRRRVSTRPSCPFEELESRQLLSATMSGAGRLKSLAAGAEAPAAIQEVDQHSIRESRKAAATYPDISGRWSVVFHLQRGDVDGFFDLQQRGRKVKGTVLIDELGQLPGPFKAKFQKAKEDPLGTLLGTMRVDVLESKNLGFGAAVFFGVIDGTVHSRVGDIFFDAFPADPP